jgi:hypothetical protein
MVRTIAVDWSGNANGGAGKMAFAEASDGQLIRLDDSVDRHSVVKELILLREEKSSVVVGLDFGFSVPAWYLRDRGYASATDYWRWLAEEGRADSLLKESPWPFWGRAGTSKPDVPAHFRLTEENARSKRIQPKSVFQINNPGSVGTGSIRGMRELHALREAGWSPRTSRSQTSKPAALISIGSLWLSPARWTNRSANARKIQRTRSTRRSPP